MSEFQFNTIDEILEDLRDGKIVVMIDDEDRENEGDVICAAEHATLENVNFMASYAKGLICMPMDESYTKKLACDRCVRSIRIIIVRHLRCLLTIKIRQRAFLPMNVLLRR